MFERAFPDLRSTRFPQFSTDVSTRIAHADHAISGAPRGRALFTAKDARKTSSAKRSSIPSRTSSAFADVRALPAALRRRSPVKVSLNIELARLFGPTVRESIDQFQISGPRRRNPPSRPIWPPEMPGGSFASRGQVERYDLQIGFRNSREFHSRRWEVRVFFRFRRDLTEWSW